VTLRPHEGGGGASRPRVDDDGSLIRHEEEATVGKRWQGVGYLRVRREVDTDRVSERFQRRAEQLTSERVPAGPDDSGKIETLPDGSISIPLFEEQLVVTRKTVLRERVIIHKDVVADWETVEAELRREHISFETDGVPEGSVEGDLSDSG
jgi:uncharacterized protein (TIGR02271 family)